MTKELEKVKYDVSDTVDQKFEHIERTLDRETQTLRKTYNELTADLNKTNEVLNGSFEDKVHTLRTLCATYFAKNDEKVSESLRKVTKMEASHDQFTMNFVNPAKEVDAKVHVMTSRLE